MSRCRLAILSLALVACSARSSSPGEPPRRPQEVAPRATENTELFPRDPREAMLAATVASLLEKEHVRHKRIDDDLSRDAFAIYVDGLDPGKMFLLRQDTAALGPFADKIDDELHSGMLELAHAGSRIYTARVAVVERMVAEILSKPLNLDDEEFIELDPKKVELAADDAELRERWRRRLELEVLERLSAMEARLASTGAKKEKPSTSPHGATPVGTQDDVDDDAAAAPPADQIPATPEAREEKARTDLARAYAGRFARLKTPAPLAPATALINAVTAVFDPHTDYLPPADKANFDIQMSGSLEGIGAVLRERDHYIEIVEVVPGGAGWREGHIAVGDLILSVTNAGQDPVDVTDMRIDEVVKMVRGPKGTVVKLRIKKSTGEEQTVAITRDVVVIEEAYARGAILSHGKGPSYGYIHLPSFYGGPGSGQRTAAHDVRRLLDEMKAKKVAGVILDLRSNGGGYLGAAVEITGLLVDRGPVVQVADSAGRREVLADTDSGESYDGPLIVLVDRFSASASEIVAGALQDYHRALIVGTGLTHGKGTVQSLASLDRLTGGNVDLGVLKLTIQQYFRVSGASTQLQGVTPEIILPDPAGHIDAGERELKNPIPWSQIDTAPHQDWKATWKTDALVARSAARVAKDSVLTKIVARTQLLRTWRDDTRLPLQRAAWEAHRNAHKAALEATSPDLAKTPARFTVQLLDESTAKLAPGPGGKTDDRPLKYRDSLARDPWVDECLAILGDMAR